MTTKNQLSVDDLPKEKLPDFWNDNLRINALYAPFRERSVNPVDWDSKLNFWRNFIKSWCEYNKICVISEVDLKHWFITKGRIPACLNIVLHELYRNQEIQDVKQFMETPQTTWRAWALDMAIIKPLKWTFGKVTNAISSPMKSDMKFVHLQTVEKLSQEIFSNIPEEYRDTIITVDELINFDILKNSDPETYKYLIHFLHCNRKIDVLNDFKSEFISNKSVKLIKFSKIGHNVISINDIDLAKYNLQQNEKLLIKKIEQLECEKTEAHRTAKLYLSKGMRQMAKTNLRKQHEFERKIEKQATMLMNIQELLSNIGTAETDGKVLDSYQHAISALKSIFKESGLTESHVDDTMLQVNEILESNDEIQTSLSQSISSMVDAELEEELAELLSEPSSVPPHIPPPRDNQSNDNFHDLESRFKDLNLPTVPVESPQLSFKETSAV